MLDEVIIYPYIKKITILAEDGSVSFTIRKIDGHTIEIGGGDVTKDSGVLYDEQLQIIPRYSNVIQLSKREYE
jgi:hypothetical protein